MIKLKRRIAKSTMQITFDALKHRYRETDYRTCFSIYV